MTMRATFALVLLAATSHVMADDHGQRWWRDHWREGEWPQPCEVKYKEKKDGYKREVKCKDGIGATWHGKWKDEFWDGACKVKQEANREKFKEEVKCKYRG